VCPHAGTSGSAAADLGTSRYGSAWEESNYTTRSRRTENKRKSRKGNAKNN